MNIEEKIIQFAPQLGGVFSYADLCNLIASSTEQKNKRKIKRLIEKESLVKIQRGFYTTSSPDLWVLASRIKPKAYISMDSILSKNGLIGTIPQNSVSLVLMGGKKQTIKTPFGIIKYFSIQESLAFGFSKTSQGYKVADNEKAYLDLLYYYSKGARFVIDVKNEVNTQKLDPKKIQGYLKKYRNPKFISFVQGELNANS